MKCWSRGALSHRLPWKGRSLTLRSIIEKRERLGVHDLMRLVHIVNPTGRELESKDSEFLYEVKAALQSALILSYPESLDVQVAGDDPGLEWQEDLVALRHRLGHGDACHARVSHLAPEAEDWVRASIRDGSPDSTASARHMPELAAPSLLKKKRVEPKGNQAPPEVTVESILATARSLVEDYEFEAARRPMKSY